MIFFNEQPVEKLLEYVQIDRLIDYSKDVQLEDFGEQLALGLRFQCDAGNVGVVHSNDFEHRDVGVGVIDVDDGCVDALLFEDVDELMDVPCYE